MTVYDSLAAWINSFLACMGGYLACGVKSTHVSKDDTQNGQQYQGQVVVDQPSLSDDFWGTSTDYLPGLSQRSISSLSTSNLSFYSDIGSASTNSRGEFVNHGLRLWKQTRLQWLGAKTRVQSNQAQGATISQNATYDSLLNSRQHFRRPIPLGEMVDFLIDTWEQEGLYD